MLYLVDNFDFTLIQKTQDFYRLFLFYEITEKRLKEMIDNNRVRTIFSKEEILNLFSITNKVQIVHTDQIKLKKFDKLITWKDGRIFVLQLLDYNEWEKLWEKKYLKNNG